MLSLETGHVDPPQRGHLGGCDETLVSGVVLRCRGGPGGGHPAGRGRGRDATGHSHPPAGRLRSRSATPRALGAHAQGTVTTSYNWSGYDDSTEGPFATVTATWVQPRVHTTGATFTDAAFWVGLDGDNSDTVEQIGTEGYSEGVAGYDAWYEMYPPTR